MGNVTVIPQKVYSAGDRQEAIVDFVFSASYATGGDTIVPTALGFEYEIDSIQPIAATTSAGATIQPTYVVVWDYVNKKLLLFTTFPGTQATAASDQSGTRVRCEVKFKGTLAVVNG